MEKAIKNKVAKAVVPAIDVMFQALRFISHTVAFCCTPYINRCYTCILSTAYQTLCRAFFDNLQEKTYYSGIFFVRFNAYFHTIKFYKLQFYTTIY